MPPISTLRRLLLAAAAGLTLVSAQAQNYPSKTISLIVPYPAGGPSDFFARKVQPEAAAKLGQTMIVENIGGAGGSIGLSRLMNAPADGHMLALASPMELVLAPLAIQGEKFSQLTKVDMLHVPYKGIAPLLSDLMGGQIDMAFLPLAGPIPATLADGKVQGLAVTAKVPHPLFKQYPPMATMKGLEGMDFDIWAGVQVHKNTPDAVVNALNKAFYAAAEMPDTRKAFEGSGNVVLASRTPTELARIYQGEIERYRAIAKSINLQPQ